VSGLQKRGSEVSSQTGDLRIKSVAPGEQAVPLKLPAGRVGSLLLASGKFWDRRCPHGPAWCPSGHGYQGDILTQGWTAWGHHSSIFVS